MDLIVQPATTLSGEIELPPSKLHTQFASALALLADGKSVIERPLRVHDTNVVLKAAEAMGVVAKRTQERWSIWGVGDNLKPAQNVIDAKNSGTALSLLTSIAAIAPAIIVINGDAQLRSRPMPTLLRALQRIGADVYSTKPDDSPPFVVFGRKLRGGKMQFSGLDARYLPALFLPCPYAKKIAELSFKQSWRSPPLELASELMNVAGVKINEERGKIRIPNRPYRAFSFRVPQELASAAPFIVAASMTNSKLKLSGIEKITGRDAVFLSILDKVGLKLHKSKKDFSVDGQQRPRAAKLDLSLAPEFLPIMAVLACNAKGKTLIQNAEDARSMKSDRISAIAHELRRMRAKVSERRDGLLIEGPAKLQGSEVDGHEDYAIVSALIVAGLFAEGKTTIKNGLQALRTSYSRFVSTFQGLGADIRTS